MSMIKKFFQKKKLDVKFKVILFIEFSFRRACNKFGVVVLSECQEVSLVQCSAEKVAFNLLMYYSRE